MKSRELRGLLLAIVLFAIVAVVMWPVLRMDLPPEVLAEGDPEAGTVTNVQTVTLYPSTLITNTTVYSSQNTDGKYWNAADVFIYADIVSTSYVTVTAQVSADGTNYADADWVSADDDSTSSYTHSYVRSLSADGTEYMRVPLAGEYYRVKIQVSGSASPEIKATLRNN